MEALKITTFQAYLFWENKEKNLSNLALRLSSLQTYTDIIILPEMFNTGFTINVEKCAEEMNGPTMTWMKNHAVKYDCVVVGSLIIKEDLNYYNRLIWMRPDGSFEKYDKHHLFSLSKENEVFTAGNELITVELKGWKIRPLICYDLRFPAWSRNRKGEFDILLYVASWPDSRIEHWRQLIPARAIENQCFVIAVNRVGYDGHEVYHSGGSMCIAPSGEVVYYKPENEDLYTFTIYPKDLEENREKFKFLDDADDFTFNP